MTRLRTSFVLGYHGCDAAVAQASLQGGDLRQSEEDYDWLGSGVYFWEGDPVRAMEWATQKVARGAYGEAAVIGAVIDSGNCLDLTTRGDLDLLADAYQSLEKARRRAGLAMLENRDAPSLPKGNQLLRYLDRAVIEHLHENIAADARELEAKGRVPVVSPFDTVRGLFLEGEVVYPGGGFYSHTHTQIAVRNPACIKGLFLPRAP